MLPRARDGRHVLVSLAIMLSGCAQLGDTVESNTVSPQLAASDAAPSPGRVLGDPALDSRTPRHVATVHRSLGLAAALALVEAENADLMASAAGVEAVAARQIDAGKLANPQASVYSEDIGRPDNMQTTLQLGEALPLTARLAHERLVARGEHDVAQREADVRRLEIFGETTRTFIALLVAQPRAALADDQLALVKRLSAAEEARVEAGQVAPFERSRAIAALAEAQLRVEEARRDVKVLRRRLVSFWNGDAVALGEVSGDLDRIPPVPPLPSLLARLDGSPEVVRTAAEIELRRSALTLERTKATPDVAVTGGVRRHEDDGGYGFVAGLSIPLPVVNRNESGITEAAYRRQQAEFQLTAVRRHLKAVVGEDYEKLATTAREIDALRQTLIPSSEKAVSALREGYQARKFPLSQLLIAEQSLGELRDKLLTTLGAYHQNYVDIEQLLGGELDRPRSP